MTYRGVGADQGEHTTDCKGDFQHGGVIEGVLTLKVGEGVLMAVGRGLYGRSKTVRGAWSGQSKKKASVPVAAEPAGRGDWH